MKDANLTQRAIFDAMENLASIAGDQPVNVTTASSAYASAHALVGIASALDRIAAALESQPEAQVAINGREFAAAIEQVRSGRKSR